MPRQTRPIEPSEVVRAGATLHPPRRRRELRAQIRESLLERARKTRKRLPTVPRSV